jgi:hypothetical protein
MTTITMNCEEMTMDLKEDFASYLRIASINVHVMMLRKKDMIIIKNLDVSPLCVCQDDFVACMLDGVLQKATVHNTAKIFYNCEKTTSMWKNRTDIDFIDIVYPTTESDASKCPTLKRKHCIELCEEDMEDKAPSRPADEPNEPETAGEGGSRSPVSRLKKRRPT